MQPFKKLFSKTKAQPSTDNAVTEKTIPGQDKKVDTKQVESLSPLWDQIVNHKSLSEKIMSFLLNPFILIGGLIVALYFLTRGKLGNVESRKNDLLLAELKKLKKTNKKLQTQLDLLSGNEERTSQLHSRKILKPPTQRKETRTIYLD
jgi:hypothetical protein